jgi:hypothetical protein
MRGQGSIHVATRRLRSRGAVWSAAVLLLIASGCAPSSGPSGSSASAGDSGGLFDPDPESSGVPTPGGSVVARIQLPAPPTSLDKFVVRATLPVPKGTFPRADGKFPFSIRNANGMVAPTQVEIVSRYPLDSDGADVVEVLARVDRPAGVAVGQSIGYDVVEHVHAKKSLPTRQSVMTALITPGTVKLISEDCFGHRYTLDLLTGMRSQTGNVKVMRSGQAAVQMRGYGTMAPATSQLGAPNGALPHFFGVHSYVTTWANEEFMSLDMRVNNGPSGYDKTPGAIQDDPLGDVYFKRLSIEVPQGWQVLFDVNDPVLGAPVSSGGRVTYDIVKPNADGTLHFMPAQAMLHRRMVLTRSPAATRARAVLDQTTVAFCAAGNSPDTGLQLYSWWNPSTSRYYPQKFPLPNMAAIGLQASGELWGRYTTTLGHLTNGTSGLHPYDSPRLGWAHPWGTGYGGMTGGTEIWFYDGFKVAETQSQFGYRALELKHRMYADRMPQLLYDRTGEHTKVEQWTVQGPNYPYVPMNYFQGLMGNGYDPFGYTTTPAYQRNWVVAQGRQPSYEGALRAYKAIDFQHYTRFIQTPMALAWLGNDALAKDDLRMCAEIFRLSYHEHYSSSSGYVIGSGMLADIQQVAGMPGYGFSFGRGESWGLMSAIAAYGLSDPTWRTRWVSWFAKAADTISAGQSTCNGIIQRVTSNKILSGQYQARQSIEQAITENMLWSLKESVFRDRDPARFSQTEQTLLNSLYAMIGPLAWRPGNGPSSHLAVAPLGGTTTPYCSSLPAPNAATGIDAYQTPCSFAYGYAITGDSAFLTKAGEMFGNPNLVAALAGLYLANAEARAALIAIVQ